MYPGATRAQFVLWDLLRTLFLRINCVRAHQSFKPIEICMSLRYHIIDPVEALRDTVRYFWICEGVASNDKPFVLRTVANGCPELLFHYKGTFDELTSEKDSSSSFLTGIHGQTDRPRRFSVNEPFGIFGVYLYPYALHSLFSIPAIAFTNQLPDLDSLLGREAGRITDAMHTSVNNDQRLKLITDFLIRKKHQVAEIEIAGVVRYVIERKGEVNVRELSARCFRSHRQFERRFKEHTGFTAKTFTRILRFNSLFQRPLNTHKSLTEIALDHGYYDQSHFIHEFKSFSGYNPSTYFSGKASELI